MTTMRSKDLTQKELKDLYDYDPLTGVFSYRNVRGKYSGDVAGTKKADGYIQMKVKGRTYKAHHLAWFYEHGVWAEVIDHIDHNKSNNAIANLRATTYKANAKNQSLRCDNQSGVQGIHWQASKNRWVARIREGSKFLWEKKYPFDQFDTAVAEREAKLQELGFHINHGKQK